MCCERCYCRTAPPIDAAARRWKPPSGERERVKPTPFAQLVDDVYGALQAVGEAVTGERWCVFGLGDPSLPYMGYCPACRIGTVAIHTLSTDPPRARTEGCSSGCTDDLIFDAIWPPT